MVGLVFFSIILFFSSEWLFPSWWGSYSLGGNLYMLDWDGGEKVIVYCNNPRGRTCYSGISVIPSNTDTNQIRVIAAKSSDEWVIVKAKSSNEDKKRYYLISKDINIDNLNCDKVDCDSIIQSHIIGPLDSLTFIKEVKQKSVNLVLFD